MVVARARSSVSLIALFLLALGCHRGPWYHVETSTLPCGVVVRGYYRCATPSCDTYSPTESYQVLSAWGREFTYHPFDGHISGMFVVSGHLFLVTFDEFGHFVKVVDREGHLIPLCDLGECSFGNVYTTKIWRDGNDLVVAMNTQGECGVPRGQLLLRRVPAVFIPHDIHLLISPQGDSDNCPPIDRHQVTSAGHQPG
jgi:hypothetical protein